VASRIRRPKLLIARESERLGEILEVLGSPDTSASASAGTTTARARPRAALTDTPCQSVSQFVSVGNRLAVGDDVGRDGKVADACQSEVTGDERKDLPDFSSGKETILGDFVAEVTNLDDPSKSLHLNIPGPLFITANADGTFTLKGTGRNVFYFFPGELGPGQPGALLLLTGHTTEQFDANFNLVPGSFVHSGGVQNLCPLLA